MSESKILPTSEPLKRVDKPWGYELIWASTEKYVAKILFVRASERLSLQYHREKTETMYLEQGSCWMETGTEASNLAKQRCEAGTILHIPAGSLHRITAISDCRLFEVSTPQLDDVVRVQDAYGRV